MAAYFFVDVREVTDPAKMDLYRSRVLSTVQRYGGRYLLVGGKVEGLEGAWRPAFPVIIRFPSLQQARRWYDSDEYKDLKDLRLSSTKGDAVLFESEPSAFVTED